MTKGKITAIILASVLLLYSVLAIGLYLILPQKDVTITVHSGQLASVTDENQKFIITADYWSNHNNTGLEMFEVNITQYMDENQINAENAALYGKGIQIVGDKEGSIQFDAIEEDPGALNTIGNWFAQTFAGISPTLNLSFVPTNNIYYYDTQNETSFATINKLNADSVFKISIGDDSNAENYLMKFLGYSEQIDETVLVNNKSTNHKINYDTNYFIASMLQVCRDNSIGYGADGYLTADLGKIFMYKKYTNGSYSGEWLTASEMQNDKLIAHFSNYFTIRIRTHENGVTKASDSMFGMVQGKQNFESLDKSLADDYFHGEQAITLTEKDFDYYYSSFNHYKLKFTESIVNKIKNENSTMPVNIVINEQVLTDAGIILDIGTNNGIVLKDDLYYSIYRRLGTATVIHTNSNGSITISEVNI